MGYLGIDIGGTKVALRVEQDGRSYQTSFPWPARDGPAAESTARDLRVLHEQLAALREEWAAPIGQVGVAVPATLDRQGRVSSWPGRPSWAGLPLTTTLAELLPGTAVRCADDGDLAALAEADAAGMADLLYLGVGTGVGGGVVVAGRPLRGLGGGSVEIGHMVIDRSGPRCDCGRRGCLQAVASGPATIRRAAGRYGSPVEFPELRAAVAQRRPWAVSAIEDACDALAAAVVSVNELVHPSVARIGGGFAASLPGFVERVAEAVGRWGRPGHPSPVVGPAALGGLSSLVGAVLLARQPSGAGEPGGEPHELLSTAHRDLV
jgi:kanosamine 6-kinase